MLKALNMTVNNGFKYSVCFKYNDNVLDFLGDSLTSLHFSADGQCFLASTKDSLIRLIDKIDGQLLAEFVLFFKFFYYSCSDFLFP